MVAVRKWRPSGDQPHVTPFSALRTYRQHGFEQLRYLPVVNQTLNQTESIQSQDDLYSHS